MILAAGIKKKSPVLYNVYRETPSLSYHLSYLLCSASLFYSVLSYHLSFFRAFRRRTHDLHRFLVCVVAAAIPFSHTKLVPPYTTIAQLLYIPPSQTELIIVHPIIVQYCSIVFMFQLVVPQSLSIPVFHFFGAVSARELAAVGGPVRESLHDPLQSHRTRHQRQTSRRGRQGS